MRFAVSFALDLRHAARLFAKSPVVVAVIAITLALGIGVNATIFSVVNGFLLRPLPVRAPDEIVVLAINDKNAPVGSSGFSYPQFSDFREQAAAENSVFSDVFANAITNVQLSARERSEDVFGVYVSGNFFPALGVQPALGRFMLADESEAANARREVVLGYSYWQKRFGGDPSIIGSQIFINAKARHNRWCRRQFLPRNVFNVRDGCLFAHLRDDHGSSAEFLVQFA